MDNSILFLFYFLGAGLAILAICGIGVLISICIEKRIQNKFQSNENVFTLNQHLINSV